jgi:hypothetical protein
MGASSDWFEDSEEGAKTNGPWGGGQGPSGSTAGRMARIWLEEGEEACGGWIETSIDFAKVKSHRFTRWATTCKWPERQRWPHCYRHPSQNRWGSVRDTSSFGGVHFSCDSSLAS